MLSLPFESVLLVCKNQAVSEKTALSASVQLFPTRLRARRQMPLRFDYIYCTEFKQIKRRQQCSALRHWSRFNQFFCRKKHQKGKKIIFQAIWLTLSIRLLFCFCRRSWQTTLLQPPRSLAKRSRLCAFAMLPEL